MTSKGLGLARMLEAAGADVHWIVTNGGKSFFEAAADEALLDVALRAGVALDYRCRTGRWSTCKGRVRSGTTLARHDVGGTESLKSAAPVGS